MITDTRITIETPEGAELPLDPAGIGVRIIAYTVDMLLRAGVFILLQVVVSFMGTGGQGVILILFFLRYRHFNKI